MESVEFVNQLKKLGEELETLRPRLEATEIPREVLADFKSTIDDMRITLWATLSLTESDLVEGVAHFRMKRAEEICRLVREDIARGRITRRNPDLTSFKITLKDTLARIQTIQPN